MEYVLCGLETYASYSMQFRLSNDKL